MSIANAPLSGRKVGGSFDRSVELDRTLTVARSLRERYGITRVGETTRLDRIGIPTVTAIVPDSPDLIGVYNGKGPTRDHATASALMEAIERQVCARMEGIERFATPAVEVRARLDLDALGWIGGEPAEIVCVGGRDLLADAPLAVPVGVVQCPRLGPRLFGSTTTNGLASGNTPTEALYHALFELIERHLWSRVHLLAHLWPRALRRRAGLPIAAPDDPVASEIEVDPATPLLGELIAKVHAAGVRFRLLGYTQPGWPVGMLACISEPGDDTMFYHLGMGASWSPLHAAVRAVTEAAQVRTGDMQGAREDVKPPGRGDEGFEHGRRPGGYPVGRWYFDGPAKRVALDDFADRSQDDLGAEIALLLDVLRAAGERCVAYVDLTPPDLRGRLAVARVVVPGLERGLADGSLSAAGSALLTNPLSAFRR